MEVVDDKLEIVDSLVEFMRSLGNGFVVVGELWTKFETISAVMIANVNTMMVRKAECNLFLSISKKVNKQNPSTTSGLTSNAILLVCILDGTAKMLCIVSEIQRRHRIQLN